MCFDLAWNIYMSSGIGVQRMHKIATDDILICLGECNGFSLILPLPFTQLHFVNRAWQYCFVSLCCHLLMHLNTPKFQYQTLSVTYPTIFLTPLILCNADIGKRLTLLQTPTVVVYKLGDAI
jgi:hypothetical protein